MEIYVPEFSGQAMTFEKSNFGYLLTFMLVGAILGSALGTLVAGFVPALSVIQKSLTGPIGFNLEIISFSIKINLSSIVGIVLGVLAFRKV
jgi:hypothetical protein